MAKPTKKTKVIIESKELYLNNEEVKSFIVYLNGLLCLQLNGEYAEFSHSYPKKNEGPDGSWRCNNFKDALDKYDWHGNFDENKKVLDGLSIALKEAVDSNNEKEAFRTCVKVLEWGGVRNGVHGVANLYLNDDLIRNIKAAVDVLTSDNVDLSLFSNEKAIYENEQEDLIVQNATSVMGVLPQSRFRMNASFTKIYSLLSKKPFLIYDSRVAAALGLIVKRYWKTDHSQEKLPAEISFSYPEGRGGNRNASDGLIVFKKVSNEIQHAKCNIRANWIVEAALKNSDFSLKSTDDITTKMRAIEAALFMIGSTV